MRSLMLSSTLAPRSKALVHAQETCAFERMVALGMALICFAVVLAGMGAS